jgi:hypothetical protein
MISLKTTDPFFIGTATINNSSSLSQTIKITNAALANTQLKDVLVLGNFDVTARLSQLVFHTPVHGII